MDQISRRVRTVDVGNLGGGDDLSVASMALESHAERASTQTGMLIARTSPLSSPDVIVILLMLLFYVAIFKYFPSHIKIIGRRAKYYLVGSE
ncbi:hypothetical protein PTTG_11814 [Puccinia triticina 1-1 BBBD Race 1]|uniref:Uncharacterized protein n=2 Tax=Puccinia triticina TaxID=208348 RepID=A0A180G9B8_PUCT1|nr:uncharacterized protein PtA15_13A95 [Puccinia triticina]OAV89305.1 hypothetical protein PTTG_11814 [Puccinia triticina 1-1 BBBD Race 1]WAQ90696.1 hypothetical protein PtA15_13A95 [Puccinia triticina]WAR60884.1 hypothetical protein PtB15_13B133 [Puccinia triticina]